jgi:7,8-dihydroneopterin aldolase/epimerase/oxygenase
MGTISLEGLEFFAYHGAYAEEQKIGNRYSVDVHIQTDLSSAAASDKLAETVNYEDVYLAVKQVMQNQHKLLEHIGYSIIQLIRQKYPFVQKVEVEVSKYNPPIGGVCTRAKVKM